MAREQNEHDDFDAEPFGSVIRAIRSLRYGQVVVTVHDSRVVQIDRIEKTRFQSAPNPSGRGGMRAKGGDEVEQQPDSGGASIEGP